MPINKVKEWIRKEEILGSPPSLSAVLATAGQDGFPHARVVAIRELTEAGFIFFTQRGSRKVKELRDNPRATLVFWLAMQQREVIVEGSIQMLTETENQTYWKALPRERQLRFSTYAPTSGQALRTLSELEEKAEILKKRWADEEIPLSEFYCGFRLLPEIFYFYTVGTTTFSESSRYHYEGNIWVERTLSP
jgi:pyridoxamine 5'-phosphate oxidase